MKISRFTDSQIMQILKQAEAGISTPELCRELSQKSREEIEKLVGGKVFLEVNVVVKDNWFEHLQTMKELGYVIERK